ncbi:spore germination protein [Falsibacillus albus]|uniref:Spore germination protein n=1 Tax=Falsibacillus albus TaxID=2478915 RepID=A0A3L7JXS6_9BACI|nr:spore germination protein [Falsibacillus albus]RLQ95553.1 spore germination protein [Falsibacillus albus]
MKNISEHEMIQNHIDINLDNIKKTLCNSSDIHVRKGVTADSIPFALMFIDEIVDSVRIEQLIIDPLLTISIQKKDTKDHYLVQIETSILKIKSVKSISNINVICEDLLDGKTIIFFEGFSTALSTGTSRWPEKSLEEPKAQRTLKGPNVGFNESLQSNIGLIRKTIKSPKLKIETKRFNETMDTEISLIYVEGIADEEIVKEVKNRLKKINIPMILDSNYLEETLTSESKSIFPLTLSTDRPDVVCAEIIGGKIAIIVDGTPFVITLPTVLMQLIQSPDDYYTTTKSILLRRVLRFFSFFLSIILPGLYIAFVVAQPGLLPTSLLVSMMAQRELVPFPTLVEVLIFSILILFITESSLRLPQGVVFTVSVFSAILLGQAAVEAQLVQPQTLVVLSASFIMRSIVPINSLRRVANALSFSFIAVAAFLGLYGVIIQCIFLVVHLVSLRSFGVPYLSPMAPFNLADQKDTLLRVPMEQIIDNKKKYTKEDPMNEK